MRRIQKGIVTIQKRGYEPLGISLNRDDYEQIVNQFNYDIKFQNEEFPHSISDVNRLYGLDVTVDNRYESHISYNRFLVKRLDNAKVYIVLEHIL